MESGIYAKAARRPDLRIGARVRRSWKLQLDPIPAAGANGEPPGAAVAKVQASCKNWISHSWFSPRPLFYSLMISITVNGERRQFEPPLTCTGLLNQLELTGKRVALERNGDIVPRSRFPEQMLVDGDRLEIVVAVGGG